MEPILYKVLPEDVWRSAREAGLYSGHGIDLTDGFIHLSSPSQVAETLAKHFAGQTGLVLLSIAAESLGNTLRWEPSRGGALFPHVYGDIPIAAVQESRRLALNADGNHVLPELGQKPESH
ncbi:hypothetical protein K227x_36830 [Rubripirellula lacrimiformis]|uniref:Dihydroorotate dehydrogenase n=1 Tax=Rubripirellula lacrimiformis TaxID=1930273 RepID=A0A517NDS6_9BACT|nr:DUF952 domain-containing protein [Rubripirellula lacrimiformis]QDT05283.1 hypothetical protein K227x_36830 [Rubripirellula lacrimiformis]